MNNFIKFGARQLLPLSALSLLILSHGASANIVDNFQTDQGASCSSASNSRLCVGASSDNEAPHKLSSYVNGDMLTGVNGDMLTGERDIYIQANKESTGTSSIRVQGGKFRWSNNTGAESKVVIQWDGKDGESSGIKHDTAYNSENSQAPSFDQLLADKKTDDYTFGGKSTGLSFNIKDNEMGFDYELLLTDIKGNVATIDGESVGNESMVTFNFEDFLLQNTDNNALASGFDFTQVDNFQLTLDSGAQNGSIDFEIGMIYAAIPEPSHLALFAAGLLGVGTASRRSKNKATKE